VSERKSKASCFDAAVFSKCCKQSEKKIYKKLGAAKVAAATHSRARAEHSKAQINKKPNS
jgi:hypothetical protein